MAEKSLWPLLLEESGDRVEAHQGAEADLTLQINGPRSAFLPTASLSAHLDSLFVASLRNGVTFVIRLCVSGSRSLRLPRGVLTFVQLGDTNLSLQGNSPKEGQGNMITCWHFCCSIQPAECFLGYLRYGHSGWSVPASSRNSNISTPAIAYTKNIRSRDLPKGRKLSALLTEVHTHLSRFLSVTFVYISDIRFWH